LAGNSFVSIHLYSDQPVLAKGLDTILADSGGFRLECLSSGLPDLVKGLRWHVPDVLLLDLTPELTYSALADIRRVAPEGKQVLWVNSVSPELHFQAMGMGVRGILRKTLPAESHVDCLRRVHLGELWFEKALTDTFLSAKRVVLSRREGELITLLSHGLKNKEIATMLHISEGTVKVYLSRLFTKVGVKDRFELALYGLKNLTAGQPQMIDKPVSAPVSNLKSLMMEKQLGPMPLPTVLV
jgi:DNA-binding NarL/FixJ family response regulator